MSDVAADLVIDFGSKLAGYRELDRVMAALLSGETDTIANLANAAALIFAQVPDLNWAGFYLARGGDLVLGPFQGKPACVRIPVGRGVCGTAAELRRSVVVPDVHAFPGHIACDGASNAEIVVPLLRRQELLGVLDVDSPTPGRFDDVDRQGLERVVATILASLQAGPG